MKDKLLTHLRLGRFFALPCAACSVLLGIALGGYWSWISAMVTLSAVFLMAYGHSFNTLLDYYWTGFDRGVEEDRSRPKVYTHGQQVIASGEMDFDDVLLNGVIYLIISFAFIAVTAWYTTLWVFLIWFLGAAITFWYSWAKKYYHPELALGVGFATLGCMMGMATQPNPDYLLAGLASIPFFIMFSVVCEGLDQWIDAEANWPRGGRSLGMLVWKMGGSIITYSVWWIAIGYIAQLFMIQAGILNPLTSLSLVATVPLAFAIAMIEKMPDKAIVTGLGGVFVFHILIVVGQVI
jgi:4-hydroxybenzoate polyprenyltransferase